MIYTLTLGRNQLAIVFGRKRGRPKKIFIDSIKELTFSLIKIGTNRRFAGHPVSRILRRVFENKGVKKILGFNLAVAVLFTGVLGSPISTFTGNSRVEITALNPAVVELTTAHSVRVPLDSLEVTQGYHLFHQAVDLNGELGGPVYPLMNGVVEEMGYTCCSYGNYVTINHGSGFRSLYAHLSKIVVEKGEAVDKKTVIGTVGSSGWATGSHLHLEVYDNDRPFNPLTILK